MPEVHSRNLSAQRSHGQYTRTLNGIKLARPLRCHDFTFLLPVQARTLMALGSAFYLDALNYVHVHNFNHDPLRFDYNQILQQLGHALPDGG